MYVPLTLCHAVHTTTRVVEFLWDAVRVLVAVVAPGGWALFVVVGHLAQTGHPGAAYAVVAVTFAFGVGLAVAGRGGWRPRPRHRRRWSPNRRAAVILPVAAAALATLLQLLADHGPVVLVVLAWFGSFYAEVAVALWLTRRITQAWDQRR